MSQVDTVSGGKTCLNFLNTKNLLGTFHYPRIAYLNSNFLISEDAHHKKAGKSEMFKYALLTSKKLLKMISKNENIDKSILKETIRSRFKIRQIHSLASNLGHTFGHALEKYYNHRILHGDAVSIGILISLYFLLYKKKINKVFIHKILSVMKNLGLNIFIEKNIDYRKLVKYMSLDKKSRFDVINLVLLTDFQKIYFNSNKLPFFETDQRELNNFFSYFKKNYLFQNNDLYKKLSSKKINYK